MLNSSIIGASGLWCKLWELSALEKDSRAYAYQGPILSLVDVEIEPSRIR